jgi:hypothetical protein
MMRMLSIVHQSRAAPAPVHWARSDRGERLLDPVNQSRELHRPGGPAYFAAMMNQHKGRDTADGKAGRQIRDCLGIHLGQPDSGFKVGGRLFEHGSHHPARTAPRGPKVDQERQITAFAMGHEPSGIQG